MYTYNNLYFANIQIQYLQIQKVIIKWLFIRIKWGNPNSTRCILFEVEASTN
jgi:hypothetical protein